MHASGRLHTNALLRQKVDQHRAGPAVTLGVEGHLVVLVLLHAVQINVEEVRRVQRTSLSLRVELGAEDGARLVDHAWDPLESAYRRRMEKVRTFIARVIQVNKVWLPVRWQGRNINGISMVLASDVAPASAQIQSRDVMSTVAVLQLDSTSTSSQGQELMTQADSEDGDLGSLHQATKVIGGRLAMGWVTGAVGNEYTVEVVGDLVDRVVEWEHSDTGSTVDETTENVLLDTTVDDSNVELGITVAHVERRLGAHLADKVDLLGIGECLVLIGIVFFANGDTGQRRSLFTEIGDNGTGINTRDCGDTLTSAPLAKTLNSGPVAVLLGDIGDNNTSRLKIRRFKVFQKTVIVLLEGWHTVVANQGLGKDQDLSPVGGVGQRLRVADQRGGEDSLTRDVGTSSKRLAMENWSIPNGEGGRFVHRALTGSSHETWLEARIHRWEGGCPRRHPLEETSKHYIRGFKKYGLSVWRRISSFRKLSRGDLHNESMDERKAGQKLQNIPEM